jgi:crossover junction endodeoxyribonuclease RuvC
MSRQGCSEELCVLGVDAAARGPTGYAVVTAAATGLQALTYGSFRPHPAEDTPQRLCSLHRLIAGLLEEFSPHAMAVETVFAAPNAATALKLAEARGVVLLAAAQAGVAVHSYSPREVKLQITGYGGAPKTQIQTMVRQLLGLRSVPESPDAADALALALCHIFVARTRRPLAEWRSLRPAR